MSRLAVNNLVRNGDFESAPAFTAATTTASRYINGTATGYAGYDLEYKWRSNGASSNFAMRYDSSTSHSGTYSLKLSLTTAGGSAYATWGNQNFVNTMIPVLPSTSYTMSGWMKTDSVFAGAAWIGRVEYDGAGGVTTPGATTGVGGTTDWTFYTSTFTTNANTHFIQPRMGLGAGAVSSAWFDDITLGLTTPQTRTTATNRLAIQDVKSSLSQSGTGNITITKTATTDTIGNSSNNNYSWGVWFKTYQQTGANVNVFTKSSSKYAYQFRVLSNGAMSARLYDGSANPTVSTTSSIKDGRWHHYVGVRSDKTLTFYLDGTLVNTATDPSLGDCSESTNMVILANSFTGCASDAFLTMNSLTADEVATLYKTSYLPYSCVFRLPLNEGAGTTAYDTSGNANHGTITNGTYVLDTPTKKRKEVNGNLVYNGDFEYAPPFVAATNTQYRSINGTAGGSNTPENIFGWGISSMAGTCSAQYDNGSIKLSASATGSKIDVKYLANASYKFPFLPMLPNTSYTLTCRVKTNLISGAATTGARVQVLGLNGGLTTSNTYTVVSGLVGTQEWTTYSLVFTTSSLVRYFDIVMSVVGNDGTGTLIMDAWIDDIVLKPTTPTTRGTA